MIVIRNRFIPFKGFRAINVLGILFVRKEARIDPVMMNHEEIHTKQMQELLFVFFYLLYFIEWCIRLIAYRDRKKAYRNISFEREAYDNQDDVSYSYKRRRYAWVRKMFF